MAESPDDIVGHKTFGTGKTDPTTGFPELRHEPLTRSEADKIMAACDAAKARRAEAMPTQETAVRGLWDAWYRLTELGWQDPRYAPKDRRLKLVIEVGSTGIHRAYREDDGGWWIANDGDLWPSRPILYLPDEREATEYSERMEKARAKWANRLHEERKLP